MSAADERKALKPTTLLDHATALLAAHPHGALPDWGRPYPDAESFDAIPAATGTTGEVRARLIERLIQIHETEPDPSRAQARVADAITATRVSPRFTDALVEAFTSFDPAWRLQVGRHLAYTGRERGLLLVGLALLAEVAERSDIESVRLLGLLSRDLGSVAIKVLASMPIAAPDLVWLAERCDPLRRANAVEALCRIADPATFDWLLRHGIDVRGPSVTCARPVAETIGLADLLDGDTIDEDVVHWAGVLLVAIASRGAGSAELRKYADAQVAIDRFARAAPTLSPSMVRYATLVSLLEDLRAGQAATLAWADGDLQRTRATLSELLDRPDWVAVLDWAEQADDPKIHHRARWARQTANLSRDTPPLGGSVSDDVSGIAIRVFVPDPDLGGQVETRIFVDDTPIVAEMFSDGPASSPEQLLNAGGGLQATDEPHEVRLAEADCTEGCCGALYVTIQRTGDQVTWSRWRNPARNLQPPPPDIRFDAHQYDQEVTRAGGDHSWEWPDRTVARLIRDRLRTQPNLLAQWNCHHEWTAARPGDRGRVHMSYFYPKRPDSTDDPWLQFVAVFELPFGEPADLADAITSQLAQDPRQQKWLAGGSSDAAQQFGFNWPVWR